jgi:hypothetical protein
MKPATREPSFPTMLDLPAAALDVLVRRMRGDMRMKLGIGTLWLALVAANAQHHVRSRSSAPRRDALARLERRGSVMERFCDAARAFAEAANRNRQARHDEAA